MKQSPRYNFRYPELTDQVSAFPPDVAAQNALLLDQVIGSLTDNTNTALAGKAPTSHTHTTGQVTGLDTALAGKAAASTLDARVPSALSLRLDTTVGTRIFAGNTMIYGDTWWRNVTALAPAGTLGEILVRRNGPMVSWSFENVVFSNLGSETLMYFNAGFGPPRMIMRNVEDNTGGVFHRLRFNLENIRSYGLPANHKISTQVSYLTSAGWPPSLPGTPA